MTAKGSKGAGASSPSAAKLSAEEQAIVARWRAEVGDARFRRMVDAIARRSAGRPSTEADNEPLLRLMAEMFRRKPNATPYGLAMAVAKSAEGERERKRRSIDRPETLAKGLQRHWGKHGARLMREAARRADAATSTNHAFTVDQLLPRMLDVLVPLQPLPPALAEQFENAKRIRELLLPSIVLPPGILPPKTKPA